MSKRNPNGYGCVTRLKGNRSRPYVVRVTIYDEYGIGKQVAIDYAETEAQARIILGNYNNNPWDVEREKVTLAALFQRFSESKLSKMKTATRRSLQSAYKHCSKYYGMKYRQLRAFHMQDCIDNCGHGYSTQGAIKNLFGHLDRFAYEMDIIDKMYSQITTAASIPETSKCPFTDEEIEALWKISAEPWVDSVLTFLYSGFRISELLNMTIEQVDLKDWTFKGGVKTASGKNRLVPIHTKIRDFVSIRVKQGGIYLFSINGRKCQKSEYYEIWHGIMNQIGAEHTPHECRHTFRSLLDSAGGNKKCIDMLMGHKSKDVGERVYTHKTITELRETIELITI